MPISPPVVEFGVLGPVQVTVDGEQLDLGRPKTRLVLAALLLSANSAVSTRRLARVLWGERPPRSAAANLRTYLSELRLVLRPTCVDGDRVATTADGHLLRAETNEVDALRFDELRRRATDRTGLGDTAGAIAALRAALGLWRGEPVGGQAASGELRARVASLEEARAAVAEELAETLLGRGDPAGAAHVLRRELALRPLRERAWALLMRSLYAAGDAAAALAAYRQARATLVDELGIEPSADLQDLHRAVLARDPRLTVTASAVPVVPAALAVEPAPSSATWQVPAAVPLLVGRAAEVELLTDTLLPGGTAGVPVVAVIHGPPGVGKSALAVHVAHRLRPRYPDGCLYADLGDTAVGARPVDPAEVLAGFLRGLGAGPSGRVADLAARFRTVAAGRRLLLVLDNARDAAQIRQLLPASESCVVLITGRRGFGSLDSRLRLALTHLSHEHAVALLATLLGGDRVAAEPVAAAAIARYCDLLPLALRVAAGRLAARDGSPLGRLADRLSAEHTRLNELCLDDLTVRSSVELSYRTLPGRPAKALRLLGAIELSEVTVAEAAALLDVPADVAESALEWLVDEHLLVADGPRRYRLPVLVRLVAAERAAAELTDAERGFARRRLFAHWRHTPR